MSPCESLHERQRRGEAGVSAQPPQPLAPVGLWASHLASVRLSPKEDNHTHSAALQRDEPAKERGLSAARPAAGTQRVVGMAVVLTHQALYTYLSLPRSTCGPAVCPTSDLGQAFHLSVPLFQLYRQAVIIRNCCEV